MNIDTVSFLYSRQEFYALLRLTGCQGIPFFPQEETLYQEGLQALEDSMLISRSEKTVALDKVTAFLAYRVGKCTQCLCLTGEERFLGLFCAFDVSVLLRLQGQRWVLTPFRRYEQAVDSLRKLISRLSELHTIHLQIGDCRFTRELPGGKEAKELILQTAQWVEERKIPSGKDAQLWRQ